jgi:hypothetical protein
VRRHAIAPRLAQCRYKRSHRPWAQS